MVHTVSSPFHCCLWHLSGLMPQPLLFFLPCSSSQVQGAIILIPNTWEQLRACSVLRWPFQYSVFWLSGDLFPCWKAGEGFKQQHAGDRQSQQQNRSQQSCRHDLQTAGHVQIFAVVFYQLAKGNSSSGIDCCGRAGGKWWRLRVWFIKRD